MIETVGPLTENPSEFASATNELVKKFEVLEDEQDAEIDGDATGDQQPTPDRVRRPIDREAGREVE